MCTGFEIAALAAVGASTAATVYQGEKARSAQNRATDQATAAAEKAASEQERATNKANQKRPDVAALLAQNVLNATGGQGSTMLTGPLGVDPTTLSLGAPAKLGGGGG